MSFIKTMSVVLVLMLSACSTVSEPTYEIISTFSDKTVENILAEADKNTLILLDCDEVLITPQEIAFSPKNIENTCAYAKSYLSERMDAAAVDKLIFSVREQCEFELINKNWPEIIQNLQSNGVKTALLTAHWTGEAHGRPHVEELRKNELKSLGFNFGKSWLNVGKISFNELPATSHHKFIRYPIFDNGIIFSCNLEKGVVLEAFLKRVPYKFSKVIFIDDRRKNVKSVMNTCKENGISCIGIEYKRGEVLDNEKSTFEELKPRIDNLVKTKKWQTIHRNLKDMHAQK